MFFIKHLTRIIIIACIFLGASCSKWSASRQNLLEQLDLSEVSDEIKRTSDFYLLRKISNMSTEQKIAQLMIVRIDSLDPMENLLDVFVPGGLIHTGQYSNASGDYLPIMNKIYDLQQTSQTQVGLPFLMMVDEEGGSVSRFNSHSSNKETNIKLVSPKRMGKINNLQLIESFAFHLGSVLKMIGFNMNLAPVVDISGGQKTFIGSRSFGSHPDLVKNVSKSFIRGMKKSGMFTTFKHFPGYGLSQSDSHKQVVTIRKTKEELLNHDLIPYQFSDLVPDAIMSNIAIYPELDSSSTGTLSKTVIQKLLKETLNYKGLVISDDIGMQGYLESSYEKRAKKAIIAGHDMIMFTAFPKNQELIDIHQFLVESFNNKVLNHTQVHLSLLNILRLKSKIEKIKQPPEYNRFLRLLKRLKESNNRIFEQSKKTHS